MSRLRKPSTSCWPALLCCALLLVTLGTLSGCKVGPDYCGPPASPVADQYPTTGATAASNELPEPQDVGSPGGPRRAIPHFGSHHRCPGPRAGRLVDRAGRSHSERADRSCRREQSRSARGRRADLRSAARRGTVASSLFPQIDTDTSFTHERRPSGGVFGGSIRDWWSWGTNLSWEIDVFGRLRRLLEAADADVGERQELYRDTLVLLIAETAATYVEARSHQEQMAIVEANIEVQTGNGPPGPLPV